MNRYLLARKRGNWQSGSSVHMACDEQSQRDFSWVRRGGGEKWGQHLNYLALLKLNYHRLTTDCVGAIHP